MTSQSDLPVHDCHQPQQQQQDDGNDQVVEVHTMKPTYSQIHENRIVTNTSTAGVVTTKEFTKNKSQFHISGDDENNDIEDPTNPSTCSNKTGTGTSSSPTVPVVNDTTKPALGKAALAVLVFYSVSGGPFGVESAVRSGGYLYTLIGFCIGPIIWSVQEALMTAELACVFPEASGGMAWVEEAFGPLAGWISGYLGWLAGATDNAIYPVLFLDYVVTAMGISSTTASMHPVIRFIGLGIVSVILSYINWRGLDIVGNMAIIICCIAMSPFVIVSCVGLLKMDWSRLIETPPADEYSMLLNITDVSGGLFPQAGYATTGILWRPFLNNLFWNLNSFDAAASFSADVGSHPEKIIPSAMMWSVVMVVISYLIPLGVAFGATQAQPYEWVDGYWATVAGHIAGPYIEGWTVFAAGISNIAMFQAELSADSFQLMGMADRGHIPSIFSTRSQYGTPTYGIILGTIVIVALGCSGLDTLIQLLNFTYSIALLMEYAAFIKLRISRPDLPRPWKIPLGTGGCIILFLPTFFFTFVVLALSKYESFIFSFCTMIIGVIIYICKNGIVRIKCTTRNFYNPSTWITYNNLSSTPRNEQIKRNSSRSTSEETTTIDDESERKNNKNSTSSNNFDLDDDYDDNILDERQPGVYITKRTQSPTSFTFT